VLYELLRETTEKYPNRLAVICGDTQLTYGALKDRVDRLASGLKSLGIHKNTKIAILHKNCHRFLETYFAAAKIGAILIPMNYRLSVADFIHILDDSQASLLISQPDLVPPLLEPENPLPYLERIIFTRSRSHSISESPAAHSMLLESDERNLDYELLLDGEYKIENEEVPSDKNDRDAIDDTDIAQVYYTSGTTGKPKGVILTHKNNRVHAENALMELALSQRERWLHVSPMFHLADAWAVWAITKAGGTHVMVSRFEPDRVLDAIERHRVTLSNFIPTMLNILVNFPDVHDSHHVHTQRQDEESPFRRTTAIHGDHRTALLRRGSEGGERGWDRGNGR